MLKKLFLITLLTGLMNPYARSQTIVPGVIEIQLQPETAEQVVQQQQIRPLNASPGRLQTGVRRLDELNVRYGAASLERIFPDAGEHEEKHRRAGLHLWYRLHFDKASDVREAVKAYGALEEISATSMVYPIKRIQAVPAAESASPAVVPAAVSNDPRFSEQWHYHNTGQGGGVVDMDIDLPEAWDLTTGSTDVIVAVVDGGIDYAHPDIAANMWPGIGKNFIPGTSDVTAESHGTHVAGTIAAVTNNSVGVAGIAGGSGSGNGVRLMSCQIFDSGDGDGNAAQAIVYAADNGAVICQNSWGYEDEGAYNMSDRAAINYFIANAEGPKMKGGIVIFAAGNDNSSGNWYPARWDFVVSVAAITSAGVRASYSNYGSWVTISAPGSNVLSTTPNGRYGQNSGTSMACPHVSGVAALVLSRHGNETYTPAMLRERLISTAVPLSNDSQYQAGQMGAGLVNAFKAVSNSVPVTGVTLPPACNVYIGRTDTIPVEIQPSDASNTRLHWSSASNIVTIDESKGLVTGVAEGTTTVTVTTDDGGFTATTTVNVWPVLADSIRLAPQELTLTPDAVSSISILFYPFDVTRKEIAWHSTDETVVLVDNSGLITGVEMGSAFVVATIQDGTDEKDSCLISVVQPVTGVEIIPYGIVRLVKGGTATLYAVVRPDNAYNKTVVWASNNARAVTVKDGLLTAKAAGNAQVTATTEDGNHTAVAQVEVYETEHVPQGFSPNGDGVNDYLEITMNSKEPYSLRIFDRSGQTHYTAENYRNDWNGIANTGTRSGKKLPAGTYFYYLSGKTSGTVKTGYIIIKY